MVVLERVAEDVAEAGAYVAQIIAATATQPANQAHGWWVSPHVIVSTVRPPGMKRAVISSSPPRRRIWWSAQSRRFAVFSRRAARGWIRG